MPLFSRKPKPDPTFDPDAPVEDDDNRRPLRPVDRGLNEEHRARLEADLAALSDVDLDDVNAVSATYDDACGAWHGTSKRKRDDEAPIRARLAVALGEHISRRTDLRWSTMSDVFGTDLALVSEREGDDFILVPDNLIAGRWLNGQQGWIPGFVAHITRMRDDARAGG